MLFIGECFVLPREIVGVHFHDAQTAQIRLGEVDWSVLLFGLIRIESLRIPNADGVAETDISKRIAAGYIYAMTAYLGDRAWYTITLRGNASITLAMTSIPMATPPD